MPITTDLTLDEAVETVRHVQNKSLDYSGYDLERPYPYTYFPKHMREGLELWIQSGIHPGGFLTSVLEHDLFGAVQRADAVNIQHLYGIVSFIYNRCPHGCHGSPEKVAAWADMHARVREAQA